MKTLYHCNHCSNYIEEPERRSSYNPHAKNVCPYCGRELESSSDYTGELVTDSFYYNTPKLPCHPNYLH